MRRTMRNGIAIFLTLVALLGGNAPAREPGEAVHPLVRDLDSSAYETRLNAALRLGEMGEPPPGAVPALIRAVDDRRHGVRVAAIEALGAFGARAEAAAPRLLALFTGGPKSICDPAARSLGFIGEAAVPRIRRARDAADDPEVRWYCTLSLLYVLRAAPELLPDLEPDLTGLPDIWMADEINDAGYRGRRAVFGLLRGGSWFATRIAQLALIYEPEILEPWYAHLILDVLADAGRTSHARKSYERLDRKGMLEIQAALPHLLPLLEEPVSSQGLWAVPPLAGIEGAEEMVLTVLTSVLRLEEAPTGPSLRLGREWAGWLLDKMGPRAAPAVDTLRHALGNEDYRVRYRAARALGSIGPAAVSAEPDLVRARQDPHRKVRMEAEIALPLITSGSDDERPSRPLSTLMEELRDGDPMERLEACDALGRLGPSAAEAAPLLREACGVDHPWTRRRAVFALYRITGEAEPALTLCREWIRSGDDDHLLRALSGLAELGESAAPALPDLLPLLTEDEDIFRRIAVAVAVGRLTGDVVRTLDVLRDALRSSSGEVRSAALAAAAEMGGDVAPLLPALVLRLGEGLPLRRGAEILRRAGSAATPLLRKMLIDSDANLRLAAAWVLVRIGPEGEAAAPELLEALTDPVPTVRAEAAFALARAAPGDDRAPRALASLLTDERFEVRATAARALGLLGRLAGETVPALEEALEDEQEFVRRCAARALGRIRGK